MGTFGYILGTLQAGQLKSFAQFFQLVFIDPSGKKYKESNLRFKLLALLGTFWAHYGHYSSMSIEIICQYFQIGFIDPSGKKY